jgi:hypothetical protein
VYLTVVVPDRRLDRGSRRGGVDARARQLYAVAAEIGARLAGQVGCTDVRWLTLPELAAAIRGGFAPGDPSHVGEQGPAVPVAAAGPTRATAPKARHYDHDGWTSVAYTLLLPDKGVLMGALAPVLTPTLAGEARTMTVFYAPLGSATAQRLVGRDAISAGTAAQVRARLGFAARATHRRDAARVAGQDQRLADGAALLRIAVAAAITVPADWDAAEAAQRMEASIRSAGFHPLRLDLAHDGGFAAASVPLGVGLPGRRGPR